MKHDGGVKKGYIFSPEHKIGSALGIKGALDGHGLASSSEGREPMA